MHTLSVASAFVREFLDNSWDFANRSLLSQSQPFDRGK
jgi:hypothetical protein